MANIVIPLESSSAHYTFSIELSTQLYNFEINWNNRGEFWTIKILDSDNSLIATSVLVSNYEIFNSLVDLRIPPGRLFCINTIDNSEPTRDNLGTDILLVYEEP